MSTAPSLTETTAPQKWDRGGLPPWTYHSDSMLDLEKQQIFYTHWQIAGHISDAPEPGDYLTFDIGDERAVIIRGDDRVIRAFHNLCRHRGARVASEVQGHCKNALVCPFHGWVYNFDGTLRGPAKPKTFGNLDKSQFGLKPMEVEVWQGLIFVRFRPGPQPPVAELLAPYTPDISHYKVEDYLPATGFQTMTSPVNWKSVRDVDNEGYHVAMAHPALQDLYGARYTDYHGPNGLRASHGKFNANPGRRWSVRHYVKITPDATWLPERLQKQWGYYGIFPNSVITATPETIQFYQEYPVSTSETIIRSATYRRPVEDRRTRLARYLALRIDRETTREDQQLTIWSNEAMKSSAFEGFHLSDLEYCVRGYHDELRRLLPVMTLEKAPPDHQMAEFNAMLLAQSAAKPALSS